MAFLFFVLGLCFGSFANVLIARIPTRERMRGRSMCPSCKTVLRPMELIPVLSFMIQHGTCRTCKRSISLQYPLVELLGALVFLLALHVQPMLWPALLLALALWLLLVITIIDLKTRTISDGLNISFILVAVLYSYLTHQFSYSGPLLIGAFFGVLWVAGRGTWVGSGDVILGLGIGALAGSWVYALVSLMLTYILGALIVSLLLMTKRIQRTQYVAFAPFIALGICMVIVFRDTVDLILMMYFGL